MGHEVVEPIVSHMPEFGKTIALGPDNLCAGALEQLLARKVAYLGVLKNAHFPVSKVIEVPRRACQFTALVRQDN